MQLLIIIGSKIKHSRKKNIETRKKFFKSMKNLIDVTVFPRRALDALTVEIILFYKTKASNKVLT